MRLTPHLTLPLILHHQNMYSIKSRLPLKVVFHQKLSPIKGCPPSKVVLHQKSSSIKDHLLSKVVFHQWSSSVKDRLPSKFGFRKGSFRKSSHLVAQPASGTRKNSSKVEFQVWPSMVRIVWVRGGGAKIKIYAFSVQLQY